MVAGTHALAWLFPAMSHSSCAGDSTAAESRWNESGGSILWFAVLGVGGLAVLSSFLNLLLLPGVSYLYFKTEGVLCRDVLKKTEDLPFLGTVGTRLDWSHVEVLHAACG